MPMQLDRAPTGFLNAGQITSPMNVQANNMTGSWNDRIAGQDRQAANRLGNANFQLQRDQLATSNAHEQSMLQQALAGKRNAWDAMLSQISAQRAPQMGSVDTSPAFDSQTILAAENDARARAFETTSNMNLDRTRSYAARMGGGGGKFGAYQNFLSEALGRMGGEREAGERKRGMLEGNLAKFNTSATLAQRAQESYENNMQRQNAANIAALTSLAQGGFSGVPSGGIGGGMSGGISGGGSALAAGLAPTFS